MSTRPTKVQTVSLVLRALGMLFRGLGACTEAGAEAVEFTSGVVGKAWTGVRDAAKGIADAAQHFKGDEPVKPAADPAPAPAGPAEATGLEAVP